MAIDNNTSARSADTGIPNPWLKHLASRARFDRPSQLTCSELTHIFRCHGALRAMGVPDATLLRAARVYARRVDSLD